MTYITILFIEYLINFYLYMIKFKEQKQTNTNTHNITNKEVNLKIHEIIMTFCSRNDCYQYLSDIYESMQQGVYNKMFRYIKGHIND